MGQSFDGPLMFLSTPSCTVPIERYTSIDEQLVCTRVGRPAPADPPREPIPLGYPCQKNIRIFHRFHAVQDDNGSRDFAS